MRNADWRLNTFPCMWPAWDKKEKRFRECKGKPVKVIQGYTACIAHYRKFNKAVEGREGG